MAARRARSSAATTCRALALSGVLLGPLAPGSALAQPCGVAGDLVRPGFEARHGFGLVVAASDEVLAVADQFVGIAGGAHVYEKVGRRWLHSATVTPPWVDPNDHCGVALAILEDRFVAIACPRNDLGGHDAGAVFIFDRAAGWALRDSVTAEPPIEDAHFGSWLEADGNRLAVSASTYDRLSAPMISGTGHAYVLEVSDAGVVQTAAIGPPTPETAAPGVGFGGPLSLDGDWLMVGALEVGPPFTARGTLQIFRRDPSVGWVLHDVVASPDLGVPFGSTFPTHVALDGDRLVTTVTSPTATNGIFARTLVAGDWLPAGVVEWPAMPRATSAFASVSLSGDTLLVGNSSVSLVGLGRASGAVSRYEWDSGAWRHREVLLPGRFSAWGGSAAFGFSVAQTSRGEAFVGAPSAGGVAAGGAVRWFDCSDEEWCDAGPDLLTACDGFELTAAGRLPGVAEPTFDWSDDCGASLTPTDGSLASVLVELGDSCGASCELTVALVGGTATDSVQVLVADETPPTLTGVPEDAVVACDEPLPVPAAPSVADSCDASPEVHLTERELAGRCPQERVVVREWRGVDACGNETVAAQSIATVDAVPPSIGPGPSPEFSLWAPNHAFVRLEADALAPAVVDSCDGSPTWRIVACESDQPLDGMGDGHTLEDCRIVDAGQALEVRAERSGALLGGRRYVAWAVAEDACGNRSEPAAVAWIEVRHDRRR